MNILLSILLDKPLSDVFCLTRGFGAARLQVVIAKKISLYFSHQVD